LLVLICTGPLFPAAHAAPAARRLTIALPELVTSFDPPTDWSIVSTWIHSNISDCIVWRDRKTGRFIPWLAEKWERLNDTTWRFSLRKGIKFHNGEPFNAAAAKFTIDRILADRRMITHAQWNHFVKEIKAVDEYTVEVTAQGPEPAMLSKLAGTGCQVTPPRYMQEVGPQGYAAKPVGTGPYKFVEWRKDDRVVLQANPDYFLGRPGVDELVIRAIPEASTRVAELQRGGVDLMISVPTQDWQRIEGNASLQLVRFLTTQTMLLGMRTGPGWVTSDRRIRAAVEHAIDREALVKLAGGGIPTRTRVTPPTLGWHPNLYKKNFYNQQRARELLREAGYAGQPLTFHSTTVWPMQKEVTEAIAGMLEAVGFKINLQILDISTFREQIYFPNRNRELYMDALGNSFFDPWVAVLNLLCSRSQRTDYCRPDMDDLITRAAREIVIEKRKQYYYKIQETAFTEDRPFVNLYHMMDTVGMNKKVTWQPAPDGFVWLGNAKTQ
jgi:peptide/nickel transport system substrate-binding protein